jgi:hypothetical protein
MLYKTPKFPIGAGDRSNAWQTSKSQQETRVETRVAAREATREPT